MPTDVEGTVETIDNQEERGEVQDDLSSESLRVRYANQTYDVAGLVRRLKDEDIVIPKFRGVSEGLETEGFQRDFVWNKNQMDQFIESILIGYPIPGIFLVEQDDLKLLVLDGQQRLTTLKYFMEGSYPTYNSKGEKTDKDFKLTHISDEFKDKTYKTLDPQHRRMLNNTNIAAVVVRTIPEAGNRQAIYEIFTRINSGGTQLTAHEIRIASYAGPLVEYIDEINQKNSDWRSIYGKKDNRLRDHELISRTLAMYLGWNKYKRPLKSFVNSFYEKYSLAMVNKKHGEESYINKDQDTEVNLLEQLDMARELFVKSCHLINLLDLKKINSSVKSKLEMTQDTKINIKNPLAPFTANKNFAWADALFVGLMTRLSKEEISLDEVYTGYESLLLAQDPKFWGAATADNTSVTLRMKLSIEAFNTK